MWMLIDIHLGKDCGCILISAIVKDLQALLRVWKGVTLLETDDAKRQNNKRKSTMKGIRSLPTRALQARLIYTVSGGS